MTYDQLLVVLHRSGRENGKGIYRFSGFTVRWAERGGARSGWEVRSQYAEGTRRADSLAEAREVIAEWAPSQNLRMCRRCTKAPWQCRLCDGWRCKHFCRHKAKDGLATCGTCLMKKRTP